MSDQAPARMTSDEFIAWAMEQPKGCPYELVAGQVLGMAPERSAHALMKFHIARCLAQAVERDGLSSQVCPDGMAVEVDATATCEPDAPARCGPPPSPNTVKLTDPVIVVDVLSPSTPGSRRRREAGRLLPTPLGLSATLQDSGIRNSL